MAQSAVKIRAFVGIKPIWERPTLEPPLRWERWRKILKPAILARVYFDRYPTRSTTR